MRVHTRRGWSRVRSASHYTFVARPVVSTVAPAAGPVPGGTTFTLTGSGFRTGARVLVGGQPAGDVRVDSSSSLRATSPAGVPGTAEVRVVTPGGKSAASPDASFDYQMPPAAESSTYTRDPGTVLASGIAWVMGGTSVSDPRPDVVKPWTVGLRAGAAEPQVGDHYFVKPGTPVFPSGLVGTVSGLATQADGTTAVTVEPSPLDQGLSSVDVDFSGPLGDRLDPAPPAIAQLTDRTAQSADPGRGVDFGDVGPAAFKCKNQNGAVVTFRGETGIRLENVHTGYHLETGSLFSRPKLSIWVSGETVMYGKVSVNSGVSCSLTATWQNAHRVIFPIGTTGATVSFGPVAKLAVSSVGTYTIEQRTSRTFGFETDPDGHLRPINSVRDGGTQATASGSLVVDASAGVSVQAGLLDRVGIEGTMTLALKASARATSQPLQVCVSLDVQAKTSIGVFLDLFITRWSRQGIELGIGLPTATRCTDPVSPAAAHPAPVITTSRLPDATNGSDYSEYLATADGRGGTWSVVSGSLPPGLSLDRSDGEVHGTPNSAVRDFMLQVRFTDPQGRSDTSFIHLYVKALVLAGGDVQFALTWNSPADLDLHVIDPQGNEIWYSEPGPTSQGGYLDHDANAGCGEQALHPAENIAWPSGRAPTGSYRVFVVVYDQCEAVNLDWHLVGRIRGQTVLSRSGSGDSAAYNVSVGASGAQVGQTVAPPPTADVLKR